MPTAVGAHMKKKKRVFELPKIPCLDFPIDFSNCLFSKRSSGIPDLCKIPLTQRKGAINVSICTCSGQKDPFQKKKGGGGERMRTQESRQVVSYPL